MTARERLRNRRRSETFAFELHGLQYVASFSRFFDGPVAEVFLRTTNLPPRATPTEQARRSTSSGHPYYSARLAAITLSLARIDAIGHRARRHCRDGEAPMTAKAKQKGRPAYRRANRWDLLKLLRVHRVRYGTHFISDDDAGRAMVTALLHCGLANDAVAECAPWATEADLLVLRRDARKMAFDDIWPSIGLTDAERQCLKAWRFWPCDVSRADIEERNRERKRGANRERQRRHREDQQRRNVADRRDEAILRVLERTMRQMHGHPTAGSITLPALLRAAHQAGATPARMPLHGSWGC